ncbi:MAG: DUF1887 family protein [Nitrospirae bacterium]|nr:DUF1887 family protein [Nitrospirota bacterium]
MKTILISLISEQTIPNILAIHHFMPDELLFITTEGMERKDKASSILETIDRVGLRYKGRSSKIIVQEDSIIDCHERLDQWMEEKGGRKDSGFVVNLTGGIKIMSIAAYEYFKDYSSKMIYIPIPKNEFIAPFPKKNPGKPTPLLLRLGVIYYLTAYGLKVVNEAKLEGYKQEARERRELSEWIVESYDGLKNLLTFLSKNLREHRNDKEFYFSGDFSGANEVEEEFLRRLNFTYSKNSLSKRLIRPEIRYLTGGWLEEYCFNKVLELLDNGIDDVVIGLKLINKHGRDNEFDVMFTKDNALYFIECKSLDLDFDESTDALYKIGALQKEFGLR